MQNIIAAILATLQIFFPSQTQQIPQNHLVCLDPGHGGEDGGAINNELVEEELTLDIANRLKDLLEKNHYQVVMTRTDNETTLTNSERAQICNDHQAEVLVSIHLNSNSDTSLDYTQGLYGNKGKDQKFTESIHQSLVASLGISGEEAEEFESNALLKAKMPATLQETVFLSSSSEYKMLSNGTGNKQQQIAQALYNGIDTWFTQLH